MAARSFSGSSLNRAPAASSPEAEWSRSVLPASSGRKIVERSGFTRSLSTGLSYPVLLPQQHHAHVLEHSSVEKPVGGVAIHSGHLADAAKAVSGMVEPVRALLGATIASYRAASANLSMILGIWRKA